MAPKPSDLRVAPHFQAAAKVRDHLRAAKREVEVYLGPDD